MHTEFHSLIILDARKFEIFVTDYLEKIQKIKKKKRKNDLMKAKIYNK